MHSLISWFTHNRVAANLLMCAIVFWGLFSLNNRIPLEPSELMSMPEQMSIRLLMTSNNALTRLEHFPTTLILQLYTL